MLAPHVVHAVLAGLLLIGTSAMAQTSSKNDSGKGQNLAKNSSFEELEENKLVAWKPLFRGVNDEERAKYVKNATFIVSKTASSGSRAAGIKVKDIPPNLAFAYWEQTVRVEPNKHYRLSLMIRQEGEGKIWIVIAGKNKDFQKTEGGNMMKVPMGPDGKYVKTLLEFPSGSDMHYASIELRATGASMTALFDSATVEEIPGEAGTTRP